MKECVTHHYACECREEMFNSILKAAKHFMEKYEASMHHEYDFTGNKWSYERDGDEISIEFKKIIAKAENK